MKNSLQSDDMEMLLRRKKVWTVTPELPPFEVRRFFEKHFQASSHFLVDGSLLTGRQAVYRMLAGCHQGRTCLLVTKPRESLSQLLARIDEAERHLSMQDLLIVSDAGQILASVCSDFQAFRLTQTQRKRIWFCRKRGPAVRYLSKFCPYERLLQVAEPGLCKIDGLEHYATIRIGARTLFRLRTMLNVLMRNGRQLEMDLRMEVFDGLLQQWRI